MPVLYSLIGGSRTQPPQGGLLALVLAALLQSCIVYPTKPRYTPPVHSLTPGVTSRQDVERVVPPSSIRYSGEELLWARWDAKVGGYIGLIGGVYEDLTSTRNLVAAFDDNGKLTDFCAGGDTELLTWLTRIARHSAPPVGAAVPLILSVLGQSDPTNLQYRRITVADGKISVEENGAGGGNINGFPVSAVEQVSNAHFADEKKLTIRLHLRGNSTVIRTGEITIKPDRLWRLMWLLYSGKTPPSEPDGGRDVVRGPRTVGRRPDLKLIREGATTQSEIRALIGEFDTGVFQDRSLLWARWEQRNPRFASSPAEPYWEIINVLAAFDSSGTAAKITVCADAELWRCLQELRQRTPGVPPVPNAVDLGTVSIDGLSRRHGSFHAGIRDASLSLRCTADRKSWQFPLQSIERVTAGRFSTPATLQWLLHLNHAGRTIVSGPVPLTASATWQLVLALADAAESPGPPRESRTESGEI